MKRTEILLAVLAALCIVAIVVNTVALSHVMSNDPTASRHAYCHKYGYLYNGIPRDLNYCAGVK